MKNLKEIYRVATIRDVKHLYQNEIYDDLELFIEWCFDTYSAEIVPEIKELQCFTNEEFQHLSNLDSVVREEYEIYKKIKKITKEMKDRIDEKAKIFLEMPSIQKDLENME